jgi:hypothetical protein
VIGLAPLHTRMMDVGLSNISLADRRALVRAKKDNSFFFSYRPESLSNPTAHHWHLEAE